jgi:putative methyltransferase (TIGR04325 family)
VRGLAVLRRFIPPIIDTIRGRIRYRAFRLFYKSKANYDNKDLALLVAKKNISYKLFTEQQNHDSEESAIFLSALWFLDKFYKREKYRILDFGGGGGSHYFTHKKRISHRIEDWIVVETPSMVAACKTLEDTHLRFVNFHDLQKQESNIDLLYSSCALQYTDAPEETLSQLLQLKAKTICFSRIVLTEGDNEINILEVSKISGNGPMQLRSKFLEKNVCYKSTALPIALFESKVEEFYTIQFRIQNGPTRAFLDAGVKNAQLMTYIAILNPNQT